MVHPVCLMPVVLMNPLPVEVLFHLFSHVVPLAVLVFVVLPSPVCAALVPSGVAPSAHVTPSLFPQLFSYPSSFMQFACRTIASSPL